MLDSNPEDKEGELSSEQATRTGHGIDLEGLRAAYKEDSSVRVIIDHFASRDRNQNETAVDRLETVLERNGAALSRSAIVRAFRRLDVLGLGRFIAGRKGHVTRFEWSEKSLNVRALAASPGAAGKQQADR